MNNKGVVYKTYFNNDWNGSVERLLDASGLMGELREQKRILIKPNLVEALQPPITTPVGLIEAIVDYIRQEAPEIEIIIGDGTGSLDYDTHYAFEMLGYKAMAEKIGIELIDLNDEPFVTMTKPKLKRWPKMYLPEIVMESYLISVPVLKAHSLSTVTLTMKNMVGACPPSKFQQGGHWKKSSFHSSINEAILDLNRYRTPDFTLLDATVGMARYHLGGPTCNPPHNLLIAGYDPVATDAFGAGLLRKKWQEIGHIAKADGELGQADPIKLLEV